MTPQTQFALTGRAVFVVIDSKVALAGKARRMAGLILFESFVARWVFAPALHCAASLCHRRAWCLQGTAVAAGAAGGLLGGWALSNMFGAIVL